MQTPMITVLIPGAARPIGRAIARRFAAAGANLILPYFDWPEDVAVMEDEFRSQGVPFLAMACDLRQGREVEQLIFAAQQRFAGLDVLVNNIERGGMPIVHGSYDLPENADQWQLEITTSLTAKWQLFHHALPLLRQANQAAVVNISSIAGCIGRSGPAAALFNDAYSAANRAVASFTETWAREGAPNLRVNELMLGLIESRHGERTRGWAALGEEERRSLTDHTLLERRGLPEEVATAVYFLAVEATYMTGSVMRMDGGYLLGGDRVPAMPPGIIANKH